MFEQYRLEIIIGLTVALMIFYPPTEGVVIAITVAASLVSLKIFTMKKDPEVENLKADVRELKAHVEKLILGRR